MAKEIELHDGQSAVFSSIFLELLHRFFVIICSRGWGKSYLASTAAINAVYELMALPSWVPHKVVYIVAPTFDQVTDIYYPLLNYELGMEHVAKRSSKDQGKFWFANNVELRLVSYESIERLRGKGAYLVIIDEPSSFTKGLTFKEAWEGVIQPCIVTRWSKQRVLQFMRQIWDETGEYQEIQPGRAIVIGTPKGYNFLYDMFNFQESDSLWKSFQFDYKSSPFLDEAEIERIKHTIDPMEFNREYLARFEDSGNSVFYNFNRKVHVRNDLPKPFRGSTIEESEVIHIGIDFNVAIQASSVFCIRGDQIHYIDEFKGLPDTEQLAIAIKARYKGHKIIVYPDPSGRSRKTSAAVGVTDFSILQSHGLETVAHSKAPPIVDSVAAVNRKLMTAAGDVSMFISAECKGLILSLERTSWVDKNPDTATIDKSEGVEHFSDGVRYPIEFLFPVQAGTKRVKRGFNF